MLWDQRKERTLLLWGGEVILMVESRVRGAGGGKCRLLRGESKARDGVLCLVCPERVCPLACYMGWLPLKQEFNR